MDLSNIGPGHSILRIPPPNWENWNSLQRRAATSHTEVVRSSRLISVTQSASGEHRQHSNTRFTENGTTTIRKFSFPFHQPSEPDTTNHCESKHGAFVFLRYFILNLLGFMPARPQCITNPATFTSTWPQHSLFPCASQPSTCHKSNSQFPSLNHTRKERGLTTLFRN